MGGTAWLTRDGEVLATLEIASDRRSRRRGLRGRTGVEGGFLLTPCRQVHTFGMRTAIDVAFCAADGTVLATTTLRPRRVSVPHPRARFVVEAEAGAFGRWELREGERVEVLRAGMEDRGPV